MCTSYQCSPRVHCLLSLCHSSRHDVYCYCCAVQAFLSFVGLLRPAAPLQQQPSAPAASQQALPASSFLAGVARDEAAALADGAQDFLLLLAYLGNVHTQSSLSSQNSSVWQTRLAAEVPFLSLTCHLDMLHHCQSRTLASFCACMRALSFILGGFQRLHPC